MRGSVAVVALLKRLFGGREDAPAAEERREFPRISLELAAHIRFASPDALMHSTTFNLSAGGVFINMAKPRPVGTTVRLVLDVGERRMTMAGVIVRVEPPGVGVEFTEISADDRRYIDELVELNY